MAFTNMEIEPNAFSEKQREKIKDVLQNLLVSEFNFGQSTNLNTFLAYLIGKKGKTAAPYNNKQLNEQLCQWIIQAALQWEQQRKTLAVPVLSFCLNLTSQLSKEEQTFVKLNCQNIYESLVAAVQANESKDEAVTLGFMTLMNSFLDHKSGVQWILATTYWTDIYSLGKDAPSVYLRKKAFHFIMKLLDKTIRFNKKFCVNLVQDLIKPLNDTLITLTSNQRKENIEDQSKCKKLYENLKPTLSFIFEVLDSLFKIFNKPVIKLFIECGTYEVINKILPLSQSQDLSFELIKIQTVFIFFNLVNCFENEGANKVIDENCGGLKDIKFFCKLIKDEIEKDHIICVLQVSYFADLFWKLIVKRLPHMERKGQRIEFENQLMFIQIIPLFAWSLKMFGMEKGIRIYLNENNERSEFCQAVTRRTAVNVLEVGYKLREKLLDKKFENLAEYLVLNFQYILRTKTLLNKERAALYFQALIYSLNDTIEYAIATKKTSVCPVIDQYLSLLIETIVDLINTFELTWKDSIETISVLNLACEFLNFSFLTERCIVQGLKLLNTAISRYMSPNMALLIDCSDSVMTHVSNCLPKKIQDDYWEVRKAALEVAHAISHNAAKFPAFKNILMATGIPRIVENMSVNDEHPQIRAMAVKCLQELVEIPEMWDTLLCSDNFLENVLNILIKEAESIVRKEAAHLISRIHKAHDIPAEVSDATLSRFYDIMTQAVTNDCSGEVKERGLCFWFITFEKHLNNQGMIDRKFPDFTFSTKEKKIVKLNETEIRKRLIKVLDQLSHTGCLLVLKCAVEDSTDVEVSKRATNFNRKISELYRRYNVSCENINISPPIMNQWEGLSHLMSSSSSSPSASVGSPSSIFRMDWSPQLSDKPFLYDPLSTLPDLFCPNLEITMDIDKTGTYQTENAITPQVVRIQSVQDKSLDISFEVNQTNLIPPEVINCQTPLKLYLAPSDYLRFIYNDLADDNSKNTKTDLRDFDSVLDNLLIDENQESNSQIT